MKLGIKGLVPNFGYLYKRFVCNKLFHSLAKSVGQKSQKLFFCLIVIVFICLDVQSQPLSILWQQCYYATPHSSDHRTHFCN
jgi:hypothetical protein